MSKLTILGGEKTVKSNVEDIFTWPIITKEIEEAVLEVAFFVEQCQRLLQSAEFQ